LIIYFIAILVLAHWTHFGYNHGFIGW